MTDCIQAKQKNLFLYKKITRHHSLLLTSLQVPLCSMAQQSSMSVNKNCSKIKTVQTNALRYLELSTLIKDI